MDEYGRDRLQHNFRSPSTSASTERVALIAVERSVVAVGLAISLGRSGDLDQSVRVREVWRLAVPVPVKAVAATMPEASAGRLREKERLGGALPPQTRIDFVAALAEFPELHSAIQSAFANQRVTARTALGASIAEQRDAVGLALRLAGLSPSEVLSEPDQTSYSYMRLANRIPITEASNIRHDWSHLPGWDSIESNFDQQTFADPTSDGRRVSIYYADREGLEETTGTDLIYFREKPAGFVLVQYKRMKADDLEADDNDRYYRPDAQFKKQMTRMNSIGWSHSFAQLEDWRLDPCPFYFKFVNEYATPKSNEELVRGMYMSLPLVELALASDSTDGPKGGKRIGWNGARYLTNTDFLSLMTNGWIGSATATTDALAQLISESIGDDRLVLLARESTP